MYTVADPKPGPKPKTALFSLLEPEPHQMYPILNWVHLTFDAAPAPAEEARAEHNCHFPEVVQDPEPRHYNAAPQYCIFVSILFVLIPDK
jgi:hypothetical protein